ncbi:hypothetical protein SDRG_12352 [Saprolegnia diclina VS20]|uniref:CSC1/OSCA1-like cytosolic domain-containing protein n=1 Tax=Saprolegnia diclina (strain VS20) TaxID=1156394 RepID=T0Q5C1_SAPDV|nr:hypothetical protein SDRG_12352 [Saprolegnia diclina VS20]EQC29806.1 hypothetical protein SDRG_12352 [Saprolegnia diclina VS20]|eukprot:XP_008616645.1 hypothetical protein SDRG_12352 [Saprolegnia diclina VS20]
MEPEMAQGSTSEASLEVDVIAMPAIRLPPLPGASAPPLPEPLELLESPPTLPTDTTTDLRDENPEPLVPLTSNSDPPSAGSEDEVVSDNGPDEGASTSVLPNDEIATDTVDDGATDTPTEADAASNDWTEYEGDTLQADDTSRDVPSEPTLEGSYFAEQTEPAPESPDFDVDGPTEPAPENTDIEPALEEGNPGAWSDDPALGDTESTTEWAAAPGIDAINAKDPPTEENGDESQWATDETGACLDVPEAPNDTLGDNYGGQVVANETEWVDRAADQADAYPDPAADGVADEWPNPEPDAVSNDVDNSQLWPGQENIDEGQAFSAMDEAASPEDTLNEAPGWSSLDPNGSWANEPGRAVGWSSFHPDSTWADEASAPPLAPVEPTASMPTDFAGTRNRPGSAKKVLTRVEMIKYAKDFAAAERLGAGKSFFKTTMKDIAELGVGLQLYFLFTKYMGLCFVVMSVLALPALVMHASARGIDTQMIDPMRLGVLTIANEGVNSTANATTEWCAGNPFTDDPHTVSYLITACDVLYSLTFAGFMWFFKITANQVIARNAEAITPAKYAVYVRGLPPSATQESILQHFNARYDPTTERKEYPMKLGCWGRPRAPKVQADLTRGGRLAKPVDSTEHLSHPHEMYLRTYVAEVSIAHPTGGLLRTFLAMEYLTAKAAELNDILKTLQMLPATDAANRAEITTKIEAQLEKVTDTLEKKTSKLKELRENRANNLTDCDCAFVVFNSVEAQRRCLRDYRTSQYSLARRFQPKELRFQGTHALWVQQAPEPSNIIWENLEVPVRERRLRRYLTNFVTFLLLLVSCAVISLAQSAQATFAGGSIPNFCTEALPAVFTGNYSIISTLKWQLYWDQYPNTTCPTGSYYISYTNNVVVPQTKVGNATQCVTNRCISAIASLDTTCSTLPCFLPALKDDKTRPCTTYKASDLLKCYCEPALERAISLYGWLDGPKKMYNYQLPCQEYLANYIRKNASLFLAAATVIVVNLVLQTILRAFADFERHVSESERASAMVLKLFFAQLLNTGIIVLLVNANLSNVPLPSTLREVLNGKFDDFVRQWYISVGVGISTTMIINAVSPQIGPILQTFVIRPLTRSRALKAAVTQKQMNDLFAGPSFDISLRYPLVLNTVFVTMMYCGGIPVLLPVAALACLVMHLLDKLTIMKLYSVRTAYDEALGELSQAMLPFALLLHLGFSTWMYGNSMFLQSGLLNVSWVLREFGVQSNSTNANDLYGELQAAVSEYDPLGSAGLSSKIWRLNVFPIFLFFVIALVLFFLSQFFGAILWPILEKPLYWLANGIANSCSSTLKKTLMHSKRKYSSETPLVSQYPDFTGEYQVHATSKAVDVAKGYELQENGILVRKWTVDTDVRNKGDRMLTWEAMAAPVKTYSIHANPKYQNAMIELSHARERVGNEDAAESEQEKHVRKPKKPSGSSTVVPVE